MQAIDKNYANDHAAEVAEGKRFEFGKNWSNFLTLLNEKRILAAENSLKKMLEVNDLKGKTFLDIGSGSGLFSLAARRLGARVHSFDYDPNSVACTTELRRRFFPDDPNWQVERGSALDAEYVNSLGKFDIVYSWGVLHHTGEMWKALDLAQIPVAPNGKLFIAIYNDTGTQSIRWVRIKQIYNRLPSFLRVPFTLLVNLPSEAKGILRDLIHLQPGNYIRSWQSRDDDRGMSRWYDMIDWVGGYPYEYAAPEEMLDFYLKRGFILTRMTCKGVGLGCNEFVFLRAQIRSFE